MVLDGWGVVALKLQRVVDRECPKMLYSSVCEYIMEITANQDLEGFFGLFLRSFPKCMGIVFWTRSITGRNTGQSVDHGLYISVTLFISAPGAKLGRNSNCVPCYWSVGNVEDSLITAYREARTWKVHWSPNITITREKNMLDLVCSHHSVFLYCEHLLYCFFFSRFLFISLFQIVVSKRMTTSI